MTRWAALKGTLRTCSRPMHCRCLYMAAMLSAVTVGEIHIMSVRHARGSFGVSMVSDSGADLAGVLSERRLMKRLGKAGPEKLRGQAKALVEQWVAAVERESAAKRCAPPCVLLHLLLKNRVSWSYVLPPLLL